MIPLNEDTIEILGWPNFACGKIAVQLRRMGFDIAEKAEIEQAHVIHWMLGLYETHGAGWREEGDKILDAMSKQEKSE